MEAACHAAKLAKKFGYEVELVHVYDAKHGDWSGDLASAEKFLEDKAGDVATKTGVKVTHEIHEGNPGKLIARIARGEQYAMVAVGYTGQNGFLSRIGSVSSKIVRLVDKPVLVTVPGQDNNGPVIGCIDFSEQTDKTNYWTHHVAELTGTDPAFVHVAIPFETIISSAPNTGGLGLTEAVLTRLGGSEQGYVSRLEESVRNRLGMEKEGEVKVLQGNIPSKHISEYAAGRKASMVVLGRHGHNTFGARIIGSTAEHILSQSHCSVLVLP